MYDPTDDTNEERDAVEKVLANVRATLAKGEKVKITFVAERQMKMDVGSSGEFYTGGSPDYIGLLMTGLLDLAKDPANNELLFTIEYDREMPLSQTMQFQLYVAKKSG